MKKNSFLWAALSMTAALVMTACSSDNDITETPAAPQAQKTIPYTVTVGGDEATTRATVDGDNQTLRFAEGDKLYITGTNIQGVLDLQDGDEGKASGATFSGELEYTGGGSPAADLELTATLVSAQQTDGEEVTINATTGAVTMNYPKTAYCADVATAVQKYSRLTGTCEYSQKAFSLTQQTAFLNFVITVTGGTPSGTTLPARFINNGATFALDNVTTETDDGVKAKFVLPVAKGTPLSSATLKLGGKEITSAISDVTLSTGKVYNVKRTVDMSSVTLAYAFTDDAVVTVKVNTATPNWFGATGTYTSGTYATTGIGSGLLPSPVSMTKDGSNLVATVTNSYNTYTVTFNTTNNTYVEDATSSSGGMRMTTLKSITINGVDITSSLTYAQVETTWDFSEMSGNPDLFMGGYTYKDVTLSGMGNLDFGSGELNTMGDCTFTAPTGKKFKKIVITATTMADISGSGWTNNMEPGNWTSTWTGDASSVSFNGNANGITSIVFTIE